MTGQILTVVVDGGGSGSRLGAFDSHGSLCATAEQGPAGLSQGVEQAWSNIREGVRALAEQLGESGNWLPSQLCLGLSGSLQNARREKFLAQIPESINVSLVTDGHAQLLGACGGQPGACLAVGTGSVLHWLDQSGEFSMAGGWGFPVGDEGSGAWLGFQLINAYLWYRDSHQTNDDVPNIFKTLEDRIGSEVSDVQVWSTTTRSTVLASLAPMIVASAKQGDNLAQALLQQGAEQCARLLALAPEHLPVYIVGGLAKIYQPLFHSSIQKRLHEPMGDVFSGLYYLSKNHGESAT